MRSESDLSKKKTSWITDGHQSRHVPQVLGLLTSNPTPSPTHHTPTPVAARWWLPAVARICPVEEQRDAAESLPSLADESGEPGMDVRHGCGGAETGFTGEIQRFVSALSARSLQNVRIQK